MSNRPEDIQARLSGLDAIGQVVGALRAIAVGQAAAAQGSMAAITAYAETIDQAFAALALAHPAPVSGDGLLLVIGASQGFSGAYPARIATAARQACTPDTGLVVLGHRTLDMLSDHGDGLPVLWSADLPGHPSMIPALASEVTDALVRLSPAHPGPIRAVIGPRAGGTEPELRPLLPRPETSATTPGASRPLTTLPPAVLLEGLVPEALFAVTALAILQGVEAEARARIEAMARAQSNLRTRRAEVQRQFQQARQEQMTTEMIELASTQPANRS
ncbi:MAG: F0F1 ATP synthase subunit gamma [Rhodobacter sp.]|nr:F0F1 ATP synthase subunit gamma [Paracoccaceae bacterium]MCC0077762.1 F0F1 ATP synthase subunit gamma [Rhodobacter sp.]